MAKKKVTKTEEEKIEIINDASSQPLTVVSNDELITEDSVNENIVDEVEVETEVEVEPTVEAEIEVEAEVEVEPTVSLEKDLSVSEKFAESISKTPFTLFQNGKLVCTYNKFLSIKIEKKYFEINNIKYTYTGLEFKY